MELSPRKQAVLAAVTKAYIKTGEPGRIKSADCSAEKCSVGCDTQK